MIDVREIKLNMRYPESRQEDITDAFMRGYTGAVEIGNKAIEKLEAENAMLRELSNVVNEFLQEFGCEDCPLMRDCRDNNRVFCDVPYGAIESMRELVVKEDK